MVAFPELLLGIDNFSKKWKHDVEQITHDRQCEFGATLTEWHKRFSNAKPDPLFLPLGEVHYVRRVAGSNFVISASHESVGLQVSDVILWLYKQIDRGLDLQGQCSKIMQYAMNNTFFYEFSMQSMSVYLHNFLYMLDQKPITIEQMAAGQKLLGQLEAKKQQTMSDYVLKKYNT